MPRIWLLLVLLIVVSPVRAQEESPALLTVSSAVARMGGSPFDTQDWIAELGQLDTATQSLRVLLPLWGANAPAYAAQVTSMQWSPLGRRLALVLKDHQGAESILLYNAYKFDFELLLSPKDGLTQLRSLSWSPDTKYFVFSAQDSSGLEQIYEVKIPGFEVNSLLEGRLPAISPDGQQMAYIAPDGGLYVLTIATHETQFLSMLHGEVGAVAWYQDRITAAVGGSILEADPNTHELKTLYEFTPKSGQDVKILSLAWSRQTMVFVLNVHGSTDSLSQILTFTGGQVRVLAERRYTITTLPDDARIFISAVYQPPGAYLHGGAGGDL
ncbi:MAG: hypothetical protein K8I82_22590 [Anaerolineae bacterium]|nr:hypothetical protein [Anaerolineae bacterium]